VIRFSEAKGYKVVSKATAETVGKITDYIVDPAAGRVAALVLKKTSGDGDTIPWADVAAVGGDALIVATEDVIVSASGELAELSEKRHAADGKRVLNTEGVELGKVKDIQFDTATGHIVALDLKGGSLEELTLVAIGSYAVIVKA
jgi:uncharacterized protein YrrD